MRTDIPIPLLFENKNRMTRVMDIYMYVFINIGGIGLFQHFHNPIVHTTSESNEKSGFTYVCDSLTYIYIPASTYTILILILRRYTAFEIYIYESWNDHVSPKNFYIYPNGHIWIYRKYYSEIVLSIFF